MEAVGGTEVSLSNRPVKYAQRCWAASSVSPPSGTRAAPRKFQPSSKGAGRRAGYGVGPGMAGRVAAWTLLRGAAVKYAESILGA